MLVIRSDAVESSGSANQRYLHHAVINVAAMVEGPDMAGSVVERVTST